MFAVAAIPVLVQRLMVQASCSALLALSPSPGANNKETLTGWTPSRASFYARRQLQMGTAWSRMLIAMTATLEARTDVHMQIWGHEIHLLANKGEEKWQHDMKVVSTCPWL